jgi:hypothetical protein
MNTPRLMQLLQVKMNSHLLEGGRLSNCAGDFVRMVEEEAGFNSIYEDLVLRIEKLQTVVQDY